MGGASRLANFAGPILGGVLIEVAGFATTFVVVGVSCLAGYTPIMMARRRSLAAGSAPTPSKRAPSGGLVRTVVRHRRLFLLGGVGPTLITAVRQGRMILLPLIGDAVGLSPATVGVLISVGTAAELFLFPVSGIVMDRYGRLHAIIPAFALVLVGLVALAMVDTVVGVVVAAVVIGIGNGAGSGTMQTLSTDIAPPDAIGEFLAGMNALNGAGRALGPLIVGSAAAFGGLRGAALTLAGITAIAVVWMVILVGETSGRDQAHVPAATSPEV
jgi:MFS family permease